MKANYELEAFGRMINDMDPHLPKGRGRCFDIGMNGGCGVLCPVFVEGDCGEPQELQASDIIDEHGEEDASEIMEAYPCFSGGGHCKKSWQFPIRYGHEKR